MMVFEQSRIGTILVGCLFLMIGVAGLSAIPVGMAFSWNALYMKAAVLVSVAAVFSLALGIGLIRLKKWARTLTVAACIVVGISGSIFAAISGNVLPDLIENEKLAMPVLAADILITSIALVIFPGAVAYYLTRPERIALFETADLSQGRLAGLGVPLAVILFSLGMSLYLFAVAGLLGIPFAFPGFFPGEVLLSRLFWAVAFLFGLWAFWRVATQDRKGWWAAVSLFTFMLVSWSVTLVIGGIDWWGSFPAAERQWLGPFSQAFERGLLGMEFFSFAGVIGYLIYIRDLFSPSDRDASQMGQGH